MNDDHSNGDRPLVSTTRSGPLLTLTLDSPANRNALSAQLVGELIEAITSGSVDPSVRAVALAHTGSTFCAGADLAETQAEGGPSAGTLRLVELMRAILECPRPVIAVVEGHVRAGGLGLVAACDLAVAGPKATFAFTEVRLGLAPAIISLTTTSRMTERSTQRYFLTGETFDAAEAARNGLITEADDAPRSVVEGWVDDFRRCSPQGLAESKKLANRGVLAAFDQRTDELVETSSRLFASDEAQSGIAAFRARRDPAWVIDP